MAGAFTPDALACLQVLNPFTISIERKIKMIRNTPGGHPVQVALPITISATTSAPIPIFRAPYPCKITKISLTVQAAVAANDTDFWTIDVVNRGPAGDQTTTMIATTTTKAASLNGLAAYVDKALTLSNTTASVTLAESDVVTLTLTKSASGANWVMPQVYIEYATV